MRRPPPSSLAAPGGQLHVTALVKASFSFAPGAEMPRAAPQEIFTAEVRHRRHPTSSVRFTSDLAPYLGQADVVFTGHAWAPQGDAVRSLPVRITLFDEHRILLDKALLVQESVPFQRMPIVYERALRGADGQENPFGQNATSDPGSPNIVDPSQPSRPAEFGPIARAWPSPAAAAPPPPLRRPEAPPVLPAPCSCIEKEPL